MKDPDGRFFRTSHFGSTKMRVLLLEDFASQKDGILSSLDITARALDEERDRYALTQEDVNELKIEEPADRPTNFQRLAGK